ncbi:hypothetical protein HPP92_015455 [Vanilla planifolia]|uniref:Uncharacterized protein n=1 Tax=Vanilla planifolia TaxID=51239 RepID=A0A835QS60_VANPL|nr:hypothetical protein HPP92_015455 [Vanilla planifolia]
MAPVTPSTTFTAFLKLCTRHEDLKHYEEKARGEDCASMAGSFLSLACGSGCRRGECQGRDDPSQLGQLLAVLLLLQVQGCLSPESLCLGVCCTATLAWFLMASCCMK